MWFIAEPSVAKGQLERVGHRLHGRRAVADLALLEHFDQLRPHERVKGLL